MAFMYCLVKKKEYNSFICIRTLIIFSLFLPITVSPVTCAFVSWMTHATANTKRKTRILFWRAIVVVHSFYQMVVGLWLAYNDFCLLAFVCRANLCIYTRVLPRFWLLIFFYRVNELYFRTEWVITTTSSSCFEFNKR